MRKKSSTFGGNFTKKTVEIIKYWEISIAEEIGNKAYQALLDELFTTPKPGLVDLYSCGAHKDMNLDTFLKSAETIKPYLIQMAFIGFSWKKREEELFLYIRPIGIEAEKAMFHATNGVNTHKGLMVYDNVCNGSF